MNPVLYPVTARQVSLGLPPPSTSSPERSPGTWQASPKVFVTIPLSYQHLFPVLFPCCPGSNGGGDLFTFLELGFNRPWGSESLSTIFARHCCNQSPKLRGLGASLLRACGRRHRRQLSRGGERGPETDTTTYPEGSPTSTYSTDSVPTPLRTLGDPASPCPLFCLWRFLCPIPGDSSATPCPSLTWPLRDPRSVSQAAPPRPPVGLSGGPSASPAQH